MRITSAGRSTIKQAVKLSEAVFKSAFMKNNYMKEPDFNLKNIRLLFDGRSIASVACVLPRIMNFSGLKLKIAGIGGVATGPRFRNRGYAAALMRDTVKFMSSEGYALSFLFPYKASFYRQFGYREVTFPFLVIDKPCGGTGSSGYEIRKMKKPDYAALNKVYESFNRSVTGSVKRPLPYWKSNCEYWAGNEKKLCWKSEPYIAAYRGRKLCAYVKISEIRKDWGTKRFCLKISESACLEGEENAMPILADRALECAKKRGFKKIFMDDTGNASIRSARRPKPAEEREYKNLMSLKMYRICDFQSLMRALSLVFAKRLKQAGIKFSWESLLAISRTERNFQPQVTLTLKKRGRSIRLDEDDFLHAVLGLKQFKGKSVLNILFPALKPVYWDFDYL